MIPIKITGTILVLNNEHFDISVFKINLLLGLLSSQLKKKYLRGERSFELTENELNKLKSVITPYIFGDFNK